MGAQEWRKAADAFGKRFPYVAKNSRFDLLDNAETRLVEFMISDEGKAAQALLKAGNRRIVFGNLIVRYYEFMGDPVAQTYELSAHGLSCHGGRHCDYFEVEPLDAVRAFYQVNSDRGDIVDWIKEQLDLIAKQMLKESTQK